MLSPPSKVVKIGEFKEFILTLIADLFDTTRGLFDNVWGQIGVMITKGRLGVTIGPPADIE